jgi:hypothetical protein
MRHVVTALAITFAPAVALAQDAAVEVAEVKGGTVTVHLLDFLTDEERTVLRVVQTNDDARALFVPEGAGFGALAVSPREGLVRDGAPVASAQAVAGLPDIEAARAQAISLCNAARKRGPDCVVVLEVAIK